MSLCHYDVYECENSSAPVLMILHGLLGSSENWRTLAKRFSEYYSVYCVDCRNHGKSFHDDEMNYQVMAQDVFELMDHLNLEKVMIMGHSMGGKVVLSCLTIDESRFSKAVVVDIAARQYEYHHLSLLEQMNALDLSSFTTRSDVDKVFMEAVSNKGIRSFLLKNLKRDSEGHFYWQCNVSALLDSYPKIMGAISFEKKSSCRVCFIKGEFSDYINKEDERFFSKNFDSMSCVEIYGAGHWVQAEQPDMFYKVVREFCD
ncbi:alpha/beta hydrolase [Candidatus Marinamargulisbacteria bacterium SCGC AG-343-D04]|nr:alpha/beta hydrolase [Candidatus Marinamargulisbacteria bacterium SCGC AG-343-D04]